MLLHIATCNTDDCILIVCTLSPAQPRSTVVKPVPSDVPASSVALSNPVASKNPSAVDLVTAPPPLPQFAPGQKVVDCFAG